MKHCCFLLVLFFGLFPRFASAQIVNIEDRRSEWGDTIAWFGAITMGFNLVENGDAIVTLKGSMNIEHQRNKHLYLSFTRYNLVRVENQDFVNDGFQHFRHNYRLRKRIAWEAFAQAQYNERIRLRLRALAGTGPRFALLNPGKQKAFVGLLYMYEYNEEYLLAGDKENYHIFRDHRLSSYISFRLQLGKNVLLTSTSYYQPVLTNFADLRLSSESELEMAITQKIRFITTISVTYDSRVPAEVNNTIYTWNNGLKWEF